MNEPQWLTEAREDIGVAEIKGIEHNPRVLRLWRDAHIPRVVDDETAWCAAAVGAWLERALIRSTRAANAMSYKTWGLDVFESGALAVPLGAILVKPRPGSDWMGHVTLAVGVTRDGLVCGLGGNQKDRVGIDTFDPKVFVAGRWPIERDARDLKLLRRLPTLDIAKTRDLRES